MFFLNARAENKSNDNKWRLLDLWNADDYYWWCWWGSFQSLSLRGDGISYHEHLAATMNSWLHKKARFSIPTGLSGKFILQYMIYLHLSGQIIIFHGSLGRISLFQIWNKLRSQKSRNSKWGRIVMFFQTTENPTVYLPNDPNLMILRNVSWNVSWVGGQSLKDLKFDETFVSVFSFWLSEAPKTKPHGFQKLPDHGVNFSKRYPVKRSKWSEADKKKSHRNDACFQNTPNLPIDLPNVPNFVILKNQ